MIPNPGSSQEFRRKSDVRSGCGVFSLVFFWLVLWANRTLTRGFVVPGGITLGHYDVAEFPMLWAVRKGLTAAKVDVPAAPPKT